jgi:hypothetical protein
MEVKASMMRIFYKNLSTLATVYQMSWFKISGFIGCLYGPFSARENNNVAINLSNLNGDMICLQPEVN